MSKHTVLFELGCEELPPKSLKTLRDALLAETEKDVTMKFVQDELKNLEDEIAVKIFAQHEDIFNAMHRI